MKTLTSTPTAVAIWAMAVLSISSCIYEGSGDEFYRTLWECDETPLDTLDVNELRLEFLCGNAISIKTNTFPGIAYGRYETDGARAYFNELSIEIEGIQITFIEADRSGDSLILRWKTESSDELFTTSMHRLSSYN